MISSGLFRDSFLMKLQVINLNHNLHKTKYYRNVKKNGRNKTHQRKKNERGTIMFREGGKKSTDWLVDFQQPTHFFSFYFFLFTEKGKLLRGKCFNFFFDTMIHKKICSKRVIISFKKYNNQNCSFS